MSYSGVQKWIVNIIHFRMLFVVILGEKSVNNHPFLEVEATSRFDHGIQTKSQVNEWW